MGEGMGSSCCGVAGGRGVWLELGPVRASPQVDGKARESSCGQAERGAESVSVGDVARRKVREVRDGVRGEGSEVFRDGAEVLHQRRAGRRGWGLKVWGLKVWIEPTAASIIVL